MVELKKPATFQEFINSNADFLDANPMLYYFPIQALNAISEGKIKVYNGFNIINERGSWLFALHTEEAYMLYAVDYDPEMLPVLAREVELEKFGGFLFAGTKRLLDDLFYHYGLEYKLKKYRIIYRCNKIGHPFETAPGRLAMGDLRRIPELAQMCVAFVKEYEDRVISLDEGAASMYKSIQNDQLYCWINGTQICSIAVVLDEHDFPVIGNFYTPPNLRGKGFGASLIYGLTDGLLMEGNDFCMLSTKASSPASNRVFLKVGYHSTGDYTLVYKIKSPPRTENK